jgi:hypothetical protein
VSHPSQYNPALTRVYTNSGENGSIEMMMPGLDARVEDIVHMDYDAGTRFWIVTYDTEEEMVQDTPDPDFWSAITVDEDAMGEPTGVSMGEEAYVALHPECSRT